MSRSQFRFLVHYNILKDFSELKKSTKILFHAIMNVIRK